MSDDDRPGPHDPTAGHLRDGHLRDGHLRDGHLRAVGGPADDGSVSLPDLLATDALLDRLGRHDATAADLRDGLARLLDSYALHADPETAGVRPVEIPDLGTGAEDLTATTPRSPRVLTASRRTLQRVGRGTAAAAAVLALLGGTAAAAATGTGSLTGPDRGTAAAAAAQLPGWFPDTVFRAFGGTPEQRVARELAQAQKEFDAGDHRAALARVQNLAEQLSGSDAVDEDLATTVTQTLDALRAAGPDDVAVDPGSAPVPSDAPTPGPTGTSLADVVEAATAPATPSPGPTPTWAVPLRPAPTGAAAPPAATATGTTEPGTPVVVPPAVPTPGRPATRPGGRPPRRPRAGPRPRTSRRGPRRPAGGPPRAPRPAPRRKPRRAGPPTPPRRRTPRRARRPGPRRTRRPDRPRTRRPGPRRTRRPGPRRTRRPDRRPPSPPPPPRPRRCRSPPTRRPRRSR